MQFDLYQNSKLFKNVQQLFTVAKGLAVRCEDNTFVILKFREKGYGFQINVNGVLWVGFPVECLNFNPLLLNEEKPIVNNNIFCLASWIEKTSEFKKENLEFFQMNSTDALDNKLVIQDKSIGAVTLNNI